MFLQIAKYVIPVFVIGSYIYVTNRDSSSSGSWVPVVIWHGMGDSCCNPLSMGKVKTHIEDSLGLDKYGNKVYVYSIEIGNDQVETVFEMIHPVVPCDYETNLVVCTLLQDVVNSYFENVNKQVQMVCNKLKTDTKLSNGYNAVGFSQGAQFLRAVAQRCPSPRMLNLISIGGQHQGVYGLPHCQYPGHKWCDYLRKLLNDGAYMSWVQDYFVQAEYWHDPLNEEEYKKGSVFLADINNELTINQNYIANLQKLDNIVFVKFDNDSMVQPIASEWFGFYAPGQAVNVTDLFSSQLYLEDRLGLKSMNSSGKLHFLSVEGDHLRFTWEWFEQEIIPYLKLATK